MNRERTAGLTPTSGGDLSTEITVPRIGPYDTFRTLGVHIPPSGHPTEAIQLMMTDAIQYATNVTGSTLSREEDKVSYVQNLLPQFRFQMPILPLSKTDCNKISSILLRAVLQKMKQEHRKEHSVWSSGAWWFGTTRYIHHPRDR
jgi:hypothetical protein